MKNYTINRFILCGFTGWTLECLWTGLQSLFRHTDKTLPCRTSLWMFPIYGIAVAIAPISAHLKGKPWLLRGSIYASLIFLVEYCTGSILKFFHVCPWDYTDTKYQLNGVVRLDFTPLWIATGLFFEKLLNESHKFSVYRAYCREKTPAESSHSKGSSAKQKKKVFLNPRQRKSN